MIRFKGKTLAILLCLLFCLQPFSAVAADSNPHPARTSGENSDSTNNYDSDTSESTEETSDNAIPEAVTDADTVKENTTDSSKGSDKDSDDNSEEDSDDEDDSDEEDDDEEDDEDDEDEYDDEDDEDDEKPTPVVSIKKPVWKSKTIHTTLQSQHKLLLSWKAAKYAKKYYIYRKGKSYKFLGSTTHTTFKDSTIRFKTKYRYKIVPVSKEQKGKIKKGKAIFTTVYPRTIVNVTKQKYSYLDLKTDCKALAKLYSNYCKVSCIGTTYHGRGLYDVCIGNPDAKRSLLVVCTIHAREYACSVLAMRQIEYYLSHYNQHIGGIKPANALKNLQIHYLVMANPDGVALSQGKYPRWKANACGVDLNRNYPYKFLVSGKKGSEGFSGQKAASERETKAIMNLISTLNKNKGLVAAINYHAMGQIVFGDYDGKDKKIHQEINYLYWMARNLTKYKSAAGYSSGIGRGNLREYLMYVAKIPNITIEIGKTWAPVAYWEYNSIFRKNKMVVLKAANHYK